MIVEQALPGKADVRQTVTMLERPLERGREALGVRLLDQKAVLPVGERPFWCGRVSKAIARTSILTALAAIRVGRSERRLRALLTTANDI